MEIGERQPPRTALHACIEDLWLHWKPAFQHLETF